jgi:hypothetical protein
MSRLPREAREGLMRAWLDVLRERHPELTWIAAEGVEQEEERRSASDAPTRLTLTNQNA